MDQKPLSTVKHHEGEPSVAEPKTLSRKDLKAAREAALKVIQNHDKEEATRIFLAGLKPVGKVVKP